MKKNLFLVTLFFLNYAYSQTVNEFNKDLLVIEGEIIGSNDTPFIAAYEDKNNTLQRDTIFIKNDRFIFTSDKIKDGKQTITIYATGKDFRVTFYGTRNYFNLPPIQTKVEKGKHFYAEGEYKNYAYMKWQGSEFVEEHSEYILLLKPLNIKRDSLMTLYGAFSKEDFKEKVNPYLVEIETQIIQETDKFIKNHPNYEISAELIWKYFNTDPIKIEEYFNMLSTDIKQTGIGQTIKDKIETNKKIKEGSLAPDFTLIDQKEEKMQLSKYKGKVVLLDFWGDWCAPCRATHPFLIELYNKYNKRGFEILGIGNGTSIPRWEKAIIDDKIGIWRHAFASGIKDFDIFKIYNIAAFPTKILINQKGEIVKIFIGDGHSDEMIQLLEKTLLDKG